MLKLALIFFLIGLAADRPRIRKIKNRIPNNTANNFAIAKDAPAIPVNPRSAAARPIKKKMSANLSIVTSSILMIAKVMPMLAKVMTDSRPHGCGSGVDHPVVVS